MLHIKNILCVLRILYELHFDLYNELLKKSAHYAEKTNSVQNISLICLKCIQVAPVEQ